MNVQLTKREEWVYCRLLFHHSDDVQNAENRHFGP